jgi:hypothetical protein
MLPKPPIEEIRDAYAVTQLHHEMQLIGIERTKVAAEALCKQTANLGYPCFIFPVPVAYIQQPTRYAQPNYK